jgi:hypothetical protein
MLGPDGDAAVHSIAQTNLQLYNQMFEQQRPQQDLLLARKAYDLISLLNAGYYQADGKPFVCHSVGVASIICHMGFQAKFIAFGLLHNVYVNGDFGNGVHTPLTPYKRNFMRERVGPEVEELIMRFRDLRIDLSSIDRIEADFSSFDETDRLLIAADLADHMEKYVDKGVLYFGDGSWVTKEMETHGPRLIALAQRLKQPLLAEMMRETFAAAEGQPPMPDMLRPSPKQKYLALTVPLSARLRLFPRIQAYVRRKLKKLNKRLANDKRSAQLLPAENHHH